MTGADQMQRTATAADRMRIAVLMTCHNRRETTVECLTRLYACQTPAGTAFDVVLVDDGCTDGTAQAVSTQFPDVRILPGDGSLYWGRGMHKAFAYALAIGYDYYLWLNDDSMLATGALDAMLSANATIRARAGAPGIVIGSMCDPESGRLNFGGGVFRWPRTWLNVRLVQPTDAPQPCQTMSGNCTLIPAEVARTVGNMDPAFEHGLGDYDYGFRATQRGVGLWIAAGTVGTSRSHPRVDLGSMSVRQRLRWYSSRNTLPPRSWALYCRRWAGPAWPVYWMLPYLKVALGPWLRMPFGRRATRTDN